MEITASNVQLASRHRAEQRLDEHESLRIRAGNGPDLPAAPRRGPPPGRGNGAEISAAARSLQPEPREYRAGDGEISDKDSLRIAIVKAFFQKITGREFQLFDPESLNGETATPGVDVEADAAGAATGEGWGLSYDYYRRYEESERTSFSAEGLVRTADGREIRFDVELTMTRRFVEEHTVRLRLGDDARLEDPLVVNLEGAGAELGETSVRFDLDADGTSEQLRLLQPGSGYLAVDHDGNGTVDDGSELFGAVSGDGFGELARHDEDGNQWIDAADSIYDRLRIWTTDGDGGTQLMALGKAGIGAIYLGHVATPFELKDGDNRLLGVVRESGLWLGDDGRAGTVQKLDLVV